MYKLGKRQRIQKENVDTRPFEDVVGYRNALQTERNENTLVNKKKVHVNLKIVLGNHDCSGGHNSYKDLCFLSATHVKKCVRDQAVKDGALQYRNVTNFGGK